MKQIKFYAVVDIEKFNANPTNFPIITIVTSKAEGFEYISKMLLLENQTHFVSWCNLRNVPCNADSWRVYVKACDIDISKYQVHKIKLDIRLVASMIRMQNGFVPLDCSYETQIEHTNFLDVIKELEGAGALPENLNNTENN